MHAYWIRVLFFFFVFVFFIFLSSLSCFCGLTCLIIGCGSSFAFVVVVGCTRSRSRIGMYLSLVVCLYLFVTMVHITDNVMLNIVFKFFFLKLFSLKRPISIKSKFFKNFFLLDYFLLLVDLCLICKLQVSNTPQIVFSLYAWVCVCMCSQYNNIHMCDWQVYLSSFVCCLLCCMHPSIDGVHKVEWSRVEFVCKFHRMKDY